VIHNGVLGTVVNKMESTYGSGNWAQLYSIGTPELMRFAEALGAETARAKTPKELAGVFELAVKRSERGVPQVIIAEAPINTSH
jgi:thiamine pyrophosphate-dependent acetolactate synthase large subunit-like protein